MLAGILAFSSKTFCNLYLAAILGNADIALRIVNTGTYEARDTTSATGAAACGAGGTSGKMSSPPVKSPRPSGDATSSPTPKRNFCVPFSAEALSDVEPVLNRQGEAFHVTGTPMELHDAFYDEHGTKLNLALHGGITLDMAPLCPYPDCEEKLQACLRKTKKDAPVYYNIHGDAIG